MTVHNKDGMRPEDTRNLMIFFAISILLYIGYEHFVLGPQKEALEKVKREQLKKAQIEKTVELPTPVELTRSEAVAQSLRRILIDNNDLKGSINLKGGVLDDVALKNYYITMEKKENVTVLSPKGSPYPKYINQGWVASDTSVKTPDLNTIWQTQGNTILKPNAPVTLYWDNGAGLMFEKIFSIDEHNLITINQSVTNNSNRDITLFPYGLVAQRGLPEKLNSTWFSHEGPMGYVGENIEEISYKKLQKTPKMKFKANQGWVGITEKYWMTVVAPPQGEETTYTFSYKGIPPAKKEKDTGLYQSDYTGASVTILSGEHKSVSSKIFAGPKRILHLQKYSEESHIPRLDLAVNFGRLWFMSKPFFHALHFLGEFFGNFGVAIIVFTILIRMAVFPLTQSSFRSFAKMKKVGPEITALRKKYSNDKAKMQKELVALYTREGVNPMAGCVPIIIQIPIFFALYRVLFMTIEMRHAPFFGWIQDLSAPDPTSVFNLFGLIPWDPPKAMIIGVWPCLMLVAMLLQRKLNPPPQDALQRDMALYFPFLMAFMMSRFAAGLVIYWTFSATIGLLQQMFIMHKMGVPIYLLGQSPEEKELEEEIEKGPALHPMTEMIEDDIEHMLDDNAETIEKPVVTPPKKKKGTKKATAKKSPSTKKPKK